MRTLDLISKAQGKPSVLRASEPLASAAIQNRRLVNNQIIYIVKPVFKTNAQATAVLPSSADPMRIDEFAIALSAHHSGTSGRRVVDDKKN